MRNSFSLISLNGESEMVDNELALKILDDPEASGIDLGEPYISSETWCLAEEW